VKAVLSVHKSGWSRPAFVIPVSLFSGEVDVFSRPRAPGYQSPVNQCSRLSGPRWRLTSVNCVILPIFIHILVFLLPRFVQGGIPLLVYCEIPCQSCHRFILYISQGFIPGRPCPLKLGEVFPAAGENASRTCPQFTYLSYSSREASTALKNSSIPSPVTLDTPTACCLQVSGLSEGKATAYLEVLVELVEYQAHAVHEAVHVCRFALFVTCVTMGS